MSRPLRVLVAVLGVAALAWAGWLAWRGAVGGRGPEPEAADTTQAGMRLVTLWFPDESGDSLVSEVRVLPELEGLHEQLAQLVDGLGRGPEHRGVAVLPPGTDVLHAFLDDRGLLALDLSRGFQQGFHGGSREEDLVVSSLVRTIGANLPEVKQVLILCGGAPIASLGGHLPLDRPLDVHNVP